MHGPRVVVAVFFLSLSTSKVQLLCVEINFDKSKYVISKVTLISTKNSRINLFWDGGSNRKQ